MFTAQAAHRLAAALEAMDVECTVTSELVNPYTGTSTFVVWVDEHANTERVDAVMAAIKKEIAGEDRVTMVRKGDRGASRCRGCGYDLRGQVEDGKCPECGHPYEVIKALQCPACHVEVPSNFDICWKCGSNIHTDEG
jgi:rubrerythrin